MQNYASILPLEFEKKYAGNAYLCGIPLCF